MFILTSTLAQIICWVYGAQSLWNLEFKTTLVSWSDRRTGSWMFSCMMMVILLLKRPLPDTICSCCSRFHFGSIRSSHSISIKLRLLGVTVFPHTNLLSLSLSPTCLHNTHIWDRLTELQCASVEAAKSNAEKKICVCDPLTSFKTDRAHNLKHSEKQPTGGAYWAELWYDWVLITSIYKTTNHSHSYLLLKLVIKCDLISCTVECKSLKKHWDFFILTWTWTKLYHFKQRDLM